IWQQNSNKNLLTQLDLLNNVDPAKYKIIALQEPHINHLGHSRSLPHWITIYPPGHLDSPKATRSLLLISKNLPSNSWTQIPIASQDTTAVQLKFMSCTVYLFNIYNNCWHSNTL
ncbi:hypothetical protein K439DRAFT_1296288, partial [Ramaria rubella]